MFGFPLNLRGNITASLKYTRRSGLYYALFSSSQYHKPANSNSNSNARLLDSNSGHYHPHFRYSRGFPFFIDLLTKPKIKFFPSPILKGTKYDSSLQYFELIFMNTRRSAVYDTTIAITIAGPNLPTFETKEKSGVRLDILHHRWFGAIRPYHGGHTVDHPDTHFSEEADLTKNIPFSTLLLILSHNANRETQEQPSIRSIFTGSKEEIVIGKDLKFEYHHITEGYQIEKTTDLRLDFYVDLVGKTKNGDVVQIRKRYRIVVPSFGEIASLDLRAVTFTEMRDTH